MSVLEILNNKAKLNPQKVAFPEGTNEKIMQAAYECGKEGTIIPVLVGNREELKQLAIERGQPGSTYKTVIFELDQEELAKKKAQQ